MSYLTLVELMKLAESHVVTGYLNIVGQRYDDLYIAFNGLGLRSDQANIGSDASVPRLYGRIECAINVFPFASGRVYQGDQKWVFTLHSKTGILHSRAADLAAVLISYAQSIGFCQSEFRQVTMGSTTWHNGDPMLPFWATWIIRWREENLPMLIDETTGLPITDEDTGNVLFQEA